MRDKIYSGPVKIKSGINWTPDAAESGTYTLKKKEPRWKLSVEASTGLFNLTFRNFEKIYW